MLKQVVRAVQAGELLLHSCTLSGRDDVPSFGANTPLTLGSFSMHSKKGKIVLCTQI